MTRVQVDVTQFFDPAEIEALARETGFVERSSPITGMKFLVSFSAGLLNTPDGTLGQLAGFLGATCGTPVSPQALDERIGPGAKQFLRTCMAKALTMSHTSPVSERTHSGGSILCT